MTKVRLLIPLLAFTFTIAAAQMPGPGHDPARTAERIASVLQLDAARAQQVANILAAAQEQRRAVREQYAWPPSEADRHILHYAMQQLHEQTRAQLATVLTAEELARWEESGPALRMRRH